MIVGGMDVSGTPKTGNCKYLGVVVGTDQAINTVKINLGYEGIHMSQIGDKRRQDKIISKLKFDSREIMAFCFKIDKNTTINKIAEMRKIKKLRIPNSKIYRTYHYLLAHHIRQQITEFLVMHNQDMSSTIFQCDGDCKNFLKESGLHHANGGNAHMLSDAVAWANNTNREPQGVIQADLSSEIRKGLIKKLGLDPERGHRT